MARDLTLEELDAFFEERRHDRTLYETTLAILFMNATGEKEVYVDKVVPFANGYRGGACITFAVRNQDNERLQEMNDQFMQAVRDSRRQTVRDLLRFNIPISVLSLEGSSKNVGIDLAARRIG